MLRISILGTGNLAGHLVSAFAAVRKVEIVQIIGRHESALKTFEDFVPGKSNFSLSESERSPDPVNLPPTTSDYSKIAEADVYIISVSDDAIPEVSDFLEDNKGLVVHTSGSVPMNVLSIHENYGVFYPLQTFSRERKLDLKSVPFCLEAKQDADLTILWNLAGLLSEKVYEVDSAQRKSLHLAAVFVNNFTNHLYQIGQSICQEKDLPFELLHPLIEETASKIRELPPYQAQTGPAWRGDVKTVQNHLNQLKNSDYKEVYTAMSESILHLYRDINAT